MGRWRGAHGEKPGAGHHLTQRESQLRGAEAGHAEIGEDAIRVVSGGNFQSRFSALRLKHSAALGFQQQRGDREADRIVVDGKDAAGPGFHNGTIVHSERAGFTQKHSGQACESLRNALRRQAARAREKCSKVSAWTEASRSCDRKLRS